MGLPPPAPAVIDYTHGAVTLGTWVFWPVFVLALLILACGLVMLVAHLTAKRGNRDVRDGGFAFSLVGVLIAGIALWSYWPAFSSSYHRWYPVSGVVAQPPDSRLIKNGDSLNQRYAVRLLGSDDTFGCDDTRCSALKTGDPLFLLCKRHWQFRGTPGWVCVYNRP